MRVLHIISGDLWAGAEVQAYTLLTTLQREPGVQVAVALLNEGELALRLRNDGIQVTVLPESRLNGFQIILELRRLMRDWKPHLIHTHRTKENVFSSVANRLTHNVPSVRTVHGEPENNPTTLREVHRHLLYAFDLWYTRSAKQIVIAVSKDLATKLSPTFDEKNIVVIENGADFDAIRAQVRPVDSIVAEPNTIHVGIVARLIALKRVDLFLGAACLLREEHPETNWRFHVFGDGPLRDELMGRAKSEDVADVTTFHGHRTDIIACIAALDCLVMCSDHEGLPMTILEAMAVGTSIVAHAVGGLRDALQTYKDCVLVETHTAAAYAKAIRKITQPTYVPTGWKPDGRFSAKSNADSILALYLALVPTS